MDIQYIKKANLIQIDSIIMDSNFSNPLTMRECFDRALELGYKGTFPIKKYARKCDVTSEGMNEGYLIEAPAMMYIKYENDLIKHLRKIEKDGNPYYETLLSEGRLTDDFLLKDYYEASCYYYTEWECEDDIEYIDFNGVITEI